MFESWPIFTRASSIFFFQSTPPAEMCRTDVALFFLSLDRAKRILHLQNNVPQSTEHQHPPTRSPSNPRSREKVDTWYLRSIPYLISNLESYSGPYLCHPLPEKRLKNGFVFSWTAFGMESEASSLGLPGGLWLTQSHQGLSSPKLFHSLSSWEYVKMIWKGSSRPIGLPGSGKASLGIFISTLTIIFTISLSSKHFSSIHRSTEFPFHRNL